ncbi:MAG: hypothetical protein ABUL58_00240, partial [Steroidobacter sp.]
MSGKTLTVADLTLLEQRAIEHRASCIDKVKELESTLDSQRFQLTMSENSIALAKLKKQVRD